MSEHDPEVLRRLDIIIRLLAISVCGADQSQKQKIATLASSGLNSREIAEFLDTTPGTVAVTMSNMRKEKGSRRTGRESPDES